MPNDRAAFLLYDYNNLDSGTDEYSRTESDATSRQSIDRFFYGRDGDGAPVLNKDGAVYMQQLVHYITSTLFPSSGEWININTVGIDNPELLAQIANVEQGMASAISQTNFYHRMTEAVYNSLLYNKAIIEPQASSGLSFVVHDHETLVTSDLCDSYSNRAYSEKDVRAEELAREYKDLPMIITSMTPEEKASSTFTVLKCIVPNREPYVPEGYLNKRYKFANVTVLKGEHADILKPKAATTGYATFPIVSFAPYGKESLAELALPAAELANKYSKAMIDRADIAIHPPVAMSLETELRNGYSLEAGGLVPISPGEVEPKAISTTLDLNVSEKTIAQQQQMLRNIFKIDYIMRAQIANLSQFEYNQNRYNALAAIEPMIADLANKAIPAVLKRAHTLLKRVDKNYKKLASNLEPDFVFTHLNRQMGEAKKLAKLGHLGQLVTPFAQINPQSVVALDVDKVLTEAAKLSGHPELVRSEQDKQEIMQAQVAQQQQLQEQELETERMKAEGGEEA